MKKREYCYICNKEVEPVCAQEKNTYTVHNKMVEVIENLFTCPNCKTELLNDNLDDSLYKIYDEYLKLYGLSFSKLKEIRNSYNLSQEQFAKALGWSKRSIIRYENADSLPQNQSLAVYKKIANNKDEFLSILKSNKQTMSNEEYYKIYNLTNADLDLKTINVFLYILKNNFLTKTQIMKNLFSVDFQAMKENEKSITTLNYAHGTYGPIIDNKDAFLTFLIKQNYLDFVSDEEDKILFRPIQECDLSLFAKEEIAIMDKVLHQLKGKDAKALTEWSHKFKGWLKTKNGQFISYEYADDFELPEK